MKKKKIAVAMVSGMMVALLCSCGAVETSVEVDNAGNKKTSQSKDSDVSTDADAVTDTDVPSENNEIQIVTLETKHTTYLEDGVIKENDEWVYDSKGNYTWHIHQEAGGFCLVHNHHSLRGYEETKEFDELNNVVKSSKRHFDDYNENGTTEYEDEEVEEYEYDEFNNMTKRIVYNSDGSISWYYEDEYDEFNNMTKRTSYNSDGSISWYYECEYNKFNNLTKEIEYNSKDDMTSQVEIEYDDLNNIVKYKIIGFSDGKMSWYEETDANGETIKAERYEEGILVSKSEKEYDKAGNLTKDISYELQGSSLIVSYAEEYEYDDAGNVVKAVQYNELNAEGKREFTGWIELEYDAAGNLTKEIHCNSEGVAYEWSDCEYDARGNLVRASVYDADGNKVSMSEFTYDENGDKISETNYYITTGDIYSTTYEYEYDTAGNLTLYTSYNTSGEVLHQEYWEYNELGNKTLHRQHQSNSNSDTFEEVWEYDANGYMTAYTKYRNDGRVAEHIEYINLEVK